MKSVLVVELQHLREVFVIKHKYRLKFSKIDKMKFIGHLDLLKIVQRTFVRAKLPIAYSKGFNPHQLMSFALPLSLSVESVGEYLDIELDNDVEPSQIKEALNKELPNGLAIIEVKKLVEGRKAAAAELRAATYEVYVENQPLKEKVDLVNSSDKVLIMKKTKRSLEEVDIKEDILKVAYNMDKDCIEMLISTGSQRNIKPEHVLDFMGLLECNTKVKRIEMFLEKDGEYIALID